MKIDFHFELMKKSIRPLFCIIVLIALGTGLSCRIAVRRNFSSPVPENEVTVTRRVVHNETLLAFAAVEIGEAGWKDEIGRLLELNLGQGRSRSISSWQRDNHDIEPRSRERVPFQLLNPKYTRLWPEFQRLLRNWSRNRRFQPEIMSDLIDLVKNPLDQHFQTGDSNRSYSSCAVVGNSGILLRKEYGELIDSHEVVIRLNNARTNGYVKNVGSKTTISFVNSNILHFCARREGCFCHPYGENVPIVMYICQAVHFMDYTVCNLSHKAPLVVTDARFDVLCSRIVKYYSLKRFMETTGKDHTEWAAIHDGIMFHYSSGMQAIMLALGICEKVSLFGFGKSVEAKHHYHTNQKVELHLHDYEAEYLFYHDLINRPMSIPFLKDSGFVIPPMSIYQ